MKTSKEWWDETKVDAVKVNTWLQAQYTGEITAAGRIVDFGEKYAATDKEKKILNFIADQERTHADWIKTLLITRGIEPKVGNPNKRYWKETMPGIKDFATGAAVAAHAEAMRLDRIRAISEDEQAPADIRLTFMKILKDEIGHERMFRQLSNAEALEATLGHHEAGAKSLGLVI
jgi:rubrerythrin